MHPSPNHGVRRGGGGVDILVLHYTGMPSCAEALARLTDPQSEVSSHYLVREDGHVIQLVPETRRAWHAGGEPWADVSDVNSRSIGIEIANGGHAGGLPAYPETQIAGVIALCGDVLRRRRIRPDRVLAHSDIAPSRKEDPGEHFPWRRLGKAGIGLWVPPAENAPGSTLRPGDACQEVAEFQAMLAAYGYGVAAAGTYDLATERVVTAFQRHFRPARIDGIADPATRRTLRDLLAARAKAG